MKRSKILVGALVALLVLSGLFLADTAKAQDVASTATVKTPRQKWDIARCIFVFDDGVTPPADQAAAIVHLIVSPSTRNGKAATAYPPEEFDVLVGHPKLGMVSITLPPAPRKPSQQPKIVMNMEGFWSDDGTPALASTPVHYGTATIKMKARGTITDPNNPPPDPLATATVRLYRTDGIGEGAVPDRVRVSSQDGEIYDQTFKTFTGQLHDEFVMKLRPNEYRFEVFFKNSNAVSVIGHRFTDGEVFEFQYGYR